MSDHKNAPTRFTPGRVFRGARGRRNQPGGELLPKSRRFVVPFPWFGSVGAEFGPGSCSLFELHRTRVVGFTVAANATAKSPAIYRRKRRERDFFYKMASGVRSSCACKNVGECRRMNPAAHPFFRASLTHSKNP